jgi:Arsenical resistance operon protein ArsD
MCCSTGVCGPAIDPVLPRFVADVHWLANQGVRVSRYNLSQEPQAFTANEHVKAALTTEGNNCLPLLLVNGRIASKGLYPDRKLLAQMMGIDLTEAAPGLSLPIIQSASQD